MNKKKSHSLSKIVITEEALISLIGKALSELELVKVPSRLSLSRQIKLDFESEKKRVGVLLRLALSPARPLQETAKEIQVKVRDVLESAAGLKVEKVEVEVTHLTG